MRISRRCGTKRWHKRPQQGDTGVLTLQMQFAAGVEGGFQLCAAHPSSTIV